MKVNVCDCCYYDDEKDVPIKDKKLIKAPWKNSIKRGPEKLSLDVCEKHKHVFKGMTFEQAREYVNKLYGLI